MAGGKGMKTKGDNYERELASYINSRCFGGKEQVHRAPLSGGGKMFAVNKDQYVGGSDLIGCHGLFVEAKRTETVSVWKFMEQAEKNIVETQASDLPIVITRRNRVSTGMLAIMRLDALLVLYRAWLKQEGYPPSDLAGEELNCRLKPVISECSTGCFTPTADVR